jgi:hypothetical protein
VIRSGGVRRRSRRAGTGRRRPRVRARPQRGRRPETETTLLGLRLGYFFTPSIFLQSLVQYSDQADVWSANVRVAGLSTAGTRLYISEAVNLAIDHYGMGHSTTVQITKRSRGSPRRPGGWISTSDGPRCADASESASRGLSASSTALVHRSGCGYPKRMERPCSGPWRAPGPRRGAARANKAARGIGFAAGAGCAGAEARACARRSGTPGGARVAQISASDRSGERGRWVGCGPL